MGKKGKGRQSGSFGSKSEKAAQAHELQQQVQPFRNYRPKGGNSKSSASSTASNQPRPRLLRLGHLKGILRERQSQEAYELLQRRRRAGFVPQRPEAPTPRTEPTPSHPPGWILPTKQDSSVAPRGHESLQSKCLTVLGRYLPDYLVAMGRDELHAALSLLSASMLTQLSITISQPNNCGMTNDLVYVLGKHSHVEFLCLRAASGGSLGEDETLTDGGLWELVPQLPVDTIVQETWEDWEDGADGDDDDELVYGSNPSAPFVDMMQLNGCNIRLKGLELIDCASLSSHAVITLLEKCSGITHLSLVGSLQLGEDGVQVVREIPNLLPALQVLDVTRCGWMSTSLLDHVQQSYALAERPPPTIHCQGCFVAHQGETLPVDW